MSNFLNQYPIFEDNQVLTSSQLNSLTTHLDEQNRLTRSKLVGTGIACGLDIKYTTITSSTNVTITFSKGLGIASEGYLIGIEDCTVTRYKSYTLPTGVQYAPFQNTSNIVDVTLYEVLTDDAPVTGPTTMLDAAFCAGKVVLFFLETVDVDLQSCLGKACDENGKERVFNLRKLMLSITDANKVLSRTCGATIPFQNKYTLPEITLKRARFRANSGDANLTDYFAMSSTYINAIKAPYNPGLGAPGQKELYTKLFDALKQTYTDFLSILAPVYGSNPFASYPVSTWNDFIGGFSGGPKFLGVQYFYDFIKDLILAYNEFRDVAFDLMSACCNDMNCHPKHLFLGEAIPVASSIPSTYRNYFITSPIFNNQKERLDQVIFYHKRIVLMLRKFDLSTINNPGSLSIRVTPSVEKMAPLSERSLPYYYLVNDPDTEFSTDLTHNWNYNYLKKALYAQGITPLGYGNTNSDQLVVDGGPVKTPLLYDFDNYNFFRVEGHLKKTYTEAQAAVQDLIDKADLPFNVVTLRLNGDPYDDIAERCDFNDLRTEYGSIRTELLSMFQNLLDRFATYTSGTPSGKALSGFITGLLNQLNKTAGSGSVSQSPTGVGLSNITINPVEFPVVFLPTQQSFSNVEYSQAQNFVSLSGGFGVSNAISVSSPPSTVNISSFLGTTSPITITASGPTFSAQKSINTILSSLTTDLTQMVVELNALKITYLPFNLTQFKFGYTGLVQDNVLGFIQHYFNAVQRAINVKVDYTQLLDLIIRNYALRNTPELYATFMAYWGETIGLLERFITDARYKSLTLLSYTFRYRLNKLAENDMTRFDNFIEKHPGLEHLGGVPAGGTFVMVYSGNSITLDFTALNNASSIYAKIDELNRRREKILAKNPKSQQDQLQLTEINSQLLNLTNIKQALANSVPIQSINLTGSQIIADFALPYLATCNCECDSIRHVTTEGALMIPALSPPLYVEYNTGDYAFAKDSDVGVHNTTTNPSWFYIDIIPLLQYDTSFSASKIRLFLIDRFGNRVAYLNTAVLISGSTYFISSTPTTNDCNLPSNSTNFGAAAVITYASSSTPQKLGYQPAPGFAGTDSFYYTFEIIDANNQVVRRSTMGKITVTVDKSESSRQPNYGGSPGFTLVSVAGPSSQA